MSCKAVVLLAVVGKVSGWKKAYAVLLFCAATAIALPAQTFTTIVNFDGTNGSSPLYGSLVQGFDGDPYGTTSGGGVNNVGTVFKVTSAGTLTTLHTFDSSDGAVP